MIKKRLILIGIFVLVAALLGGGFYILAGIEPLPEDGNPDYQFGFVVNDENIRVFNFSSRNIDYIEVENNLMTYRVRMTDGVVQIVDYESVPLLAASSAGLFNSGSNLRLETVISENCADLGEFGLADPNAAVTIMSYNSGSVTFHIGNQSPNPDYYYMCLEGENTVYLIEKLLAERYLKSVMEYCDPKIYKTFVPFDDFVSLSVKSPTTEYEFRLATKEEIASSAVYFEGIAMLKPYAWGANSSAIEDLMTSMVDLKATSVVAVCVSEEDLVQYGLDKESCTEIVLGVNADPNPMEYNNTTNPYFDSTKPTGEKTEFTVTYRIGKVTDTQVYVMFDGREVVYTIPRETFSWVDWTPYRFSAKILFGEYLSNLNSLTVKSSDETWNFTLKNAASNDKDELRVQCNGKSINPDQFRTFYASLISFIPVGEGAKPEGAEPALELLYNLTSGESHVLRFYEMDARNYAAEINGVTFLSVRVTQVEKVFSDIQKLLKGQALIE